MTTEYLNNKELEGTIAKFQKSKREKIQYEKLLVVFEVSPNKKVPRIDSKGTMNLKECKKEYKECIDNYEESKHLLALDFQKLAMNIVQAYKFNLVDADDAIQECVLVCFEKIDRFDPDKGKAFNYASTISLNHMRQIYRTARNYNDLKKKYSDHVLENLADEGLKQKIKAKKKSNHIIDG